MLPLDIKVFLIIFGSEPVSSIRVTIGMDSQRFASTVGTRSCLLRVTITGRISNAFLSIAPFEMSTRVRSVRISVAHSLSKGRRSFPDE